MIEMLAKESTEKWVINADFNKNTFSRGCLAPFAVKNGFASQRSGYAIAGAVASQAFRFRDSF